MISLLRKGARQNRGDCWHEVAAFERLIRANGDGRHSRFERSAFHETEEGFHVSVSQTTAHYVMCVEPTAPDLDISVRLAGGVLRFCGRRYHRANPDDELPQGIEWREDYFSRCFSLPADARREAVRWDFNSGILTVTVDRRSAESARD